MTADLRLVGDTSRARPGPAGAARESLLGDIHPPVRPWEAPADSAVLSLQRAAGNRAVSGVLAQRTGDSAAPVQRCGGHACPPEGCEQGATPVAQRDASGAALTEAQSEQLARRPSLALPRWGRLTADQRGLVGWKMVAAYGPDFTQDFLAYASGNKRPNLSTTVSNSPNLTSKALTTQGYRPAGNPGGVALWVHPSGHEIQVLARSGPAPDEPAEAPGCGDADAGSDCLVDSDDEESCRQCCDDKYPDGGPCHAACRSGCADKL
ncbi:hypothetical protein GCM10010124_16810 [Pilimelia terevasa]|uniref:Uncharacterized protein n=1 Tax=Pilimelia terevasa TaxID=53372 RepID=A0A8J3BPX8_9ACTN|nr:hypothetical protein [Pilimelia terevasa]GGK24918.1 hypothetical protein GCM10010124_16810 [Pilimelia terevasa]